MNNRWTQNEESKLLKLIASGKTCKELAGGFNRSENALELRLKKIIYDNINNKKPVEKISELLHMNKDIIMQYYYSYKDYIEKQQKEGGGNNLSIMTNNISESKLNKISNMNNNDNILNGGNSGNKLYKLEEQNKKMKLILENYILKHKITKLLKNNTNNLQKEALDALIKN